MRLWLHHYAQTATLTPSAVLSVAAHAVFIGAAVYGTGSRAKQVAEEIAERVYYLPPPDRMPASHASVEHIKYVDVGSGVAVTGKEAEKGTPVGQPHPELDKAGRGISGPDEASQMPQIANSSSDSVYSILDVDQSAARSEGSAAPIYPPELIQQGVEGAVLTNFVIDTTGRADSTTIEVLQASHPLFVVSVRAAIPGMRFSPASVQGRRVRQIVEQRFQFRLAPAVTPVSAPAEHTRANPVP
jgi:protein TonB